MHVPSTLLAHVDEATIPVRTIHTCTTRKAENETMRQRRRATAQRAEERSRGAACGHAGAGNRSAESSESVESVE